MSNEQYRILDRDSLPEYLHAIPAVAEVLGTDPDPEIHEIGDGNLNFVYRVTNSTDPSRSVIVKQAVPYLRMVGEEWPLGRDRMTYEIRALMLYNDLVPNLVPTIYHADEEMSTLVMQYLDDHIILRLGMIDGITYPKVGEHLGLFMAETLFGTSAWSMGSLDRRTLMDRFTLNAELCKLTEEFIFAFPYMDHESNYSNPVTDQWAIENIHPDSEFKLDVLEMKDLFVTKTDALIHGDLHTGSLMVNQAESYVIDMEFAFFGPFGFDVGKVISNFLLSATSHAYHSSDNVYSEWLVGQLEIIWNTFSKRFGELWAQAHESTMLTSGLLSSEEFSTLRQRFMVDLLRESVGFSACSMTRRTLGIAGVADVRDIPDLDVRSKIEVANLKLAKLLMAERNTLTTIDDLLALVRDYYKSPIL